MTIVWQNLTYNVQPDGTATGGGFLIDTSMPDQGIASKPAAEAYTAAFPQTLNIGQEG